ncbi:transmembrane anterior posterior transformation protein 1 homolog [Oscarella lobularis]|uniref:transmembrane anterior posterior transformation protein 1 homolog n=1 Tax=Oscarella lobularis TaxID=121494 RepID=UPI00331391A8
MKNGPRGRIGLGEFLGAELRQGYEQPFSDGEKSQTLFRNLWRTPKNLEALIAFGFLLCLDTFLFVFTILPIRILVAAVALAASIARPWATSIINPAQICDLVRGFSFVVCFVLLCFIDNSMLYHLVRGQAVIKLYVIHNVLEIGDKLLSSFNDDVFSALFDLVSTRKPRWWNHLVFAPYFVAATTTVFVHSALVLGQATVLNVAINSHNKALLTIMVSNQFVELKSNAFKRFETNNLFQISCHDMRERFHYFVLMGIVLLRNMTELGWNYDHLLELLPIFVGVWMSEVAVDWIKHAFILKFNNISSEVYRQYRVTLSKDVIKRRQNMALADQMDVVSRRVGFVPLPLGCVTFRIVISSIRLVGWSGIFLVVTSYACLFALKLLASVVLLGIASQSWPGWDDARGPSTSRYSPSLPAYYPKLPDTPFVRPQAGTSGKSRLPLDEVNRYTFVGGSIL